MSDTCRAGCNCEYAVAFLLGRCRSCCLFGELSCFLLVDNLHKLVGSLGSLELCGEVLVHKHLHKSCENLEVNVAVQCCSYHKDKLAGLSVGSTVVNSVGNCDCGKGGSLNSLALCVGNGNFHTDCGCAHLLARENTFFVNRSVVEVAASGMQINQCVDCFALVLYRYRQSDTLLFQQISNAHNILLEIFYKLIFKLIP